MFKKITWERSAVCGNYNQIYATNKWETVYKSVWHVQLSWVSVMLCAIWHYLYSLKNVKNILGGTLLLVKFQAKSNTSSWVFFTFFKFVQVAPNCAKRLISAHPAMYFISISKQDWDFLMPLRVHQTIACALWNGASLKKGSLINKINFQHPMKT